MHLLYWQTGSLPLNAPPGKPQLTDRGYLNCYDEDPKAMSLVFEKENYKHQDWRLMCVNHAFAVPSISLL